MSTQLLEPGIREDEITGEVAAVAAPPIAGVSFDRATRHRLVVAEHVANTLESLSDARAWDRLDPAMLISSRMRARWRSTSPTWASSARFATSRMRPSASSDSSGAWRSRSISSRRRPTAARRGAGCSSATSPRSRSSRAMLPVRAGRDRRRSSRPTPRPGRRSAQGSAGSRPGGRSRGNRCRAPSVRRRRPPAVASRSGSRRGPSSRRRPWDGTSRRPTRKRASSPAPRVRACP